MRFFQSLLRQVAYLVAVLIILFALITVVVTEVEPPVQPLITGISNVGSVANISVAGVADIPHVLQVSSDLAMWNSIATNTPSSATVTFEDSNAGGLRFYRVILQ